MIKTIITNKKAFYNYFLDKKYIAGLQLLGNEVKSIRLGKVNLDNAYVIIRRNEVFVVNMIVSKYTFSNMFFYEEKRDKKLLLNKSEIFQIKNKIQIKSFVIVPTKIYNIKNLLKLEICLAKGKKKFDKRFILKEKDEKSQIKKIMNQNKYF
jgi:SsrA-binding protein